MGLVSLFFYTHIFYIFFSFLLYFIFYIILYINTMHSPHISPTLVCTNDGLTSFFLNHLGIYNAQFTFFETNRVWIFDSVFVFDFIQVYIPCKNLHTYTNRSSINMV